MQARLLGFGEKGEVPSSLIWAQSPCSMRSAASTCYLLYSHPSIAKARPYPRPLASNPFPSSCSCDRATECTHATILKQPHPALDSRVLCLPGGGSQAWVARCSGDEAARLPCRAAGVLARPLAPPLSTACCPRPQYLTAFTHCYLAVLSLPCCRVSEATP